MSMTCVLTTKNPGLENNEQRFRHRISPLTSGSALERRFSCRTTDSQQSCGQRIDIKRKLDHDYDYDHDRDRDDDRQDTRALTSKGNISLLPIETHRDEAIASLSTYTELPSTMKVTP
ncbi:hypothetical protein H9Q74_003132 [Fusarium xylarioides]|nr:hypothetical protein H9Q71_003439 [Fusarium xylarioides]KAG5826775.1 hypothetical protein H9Q74_003132 [Fusarium xylarioides]